MDRSIASSRLLLCSSLAFCFAFIRYSGLQSYDDIVKELLNINKEEPNFLKWDMKFIDKKILEYIKTGADSAPAIRFELRYIDYSLSLRAVEYHLNALEEKKLIIKIPGRPLKYKINSEIL